MAAVHKGFRYSRFEGYRCSGTIVRRSSIWVHERTLLVAEGTGVLSIISTCMKVSSKILQACYFSEPRKNVLLPPNKYSRAFRDN